MQTIFNIVVAIVVFWLVYAYLLPMLPEPIRTIALVLLVIAAIAYAFGFISGPRWPIT
jgi:Na+-translocating ferredoxin:NAD+ oxidoreductase RnfA subunit